MFCHTFLTIVTESLHLLGSIGPHLNKMIVTYILTREFYPLSFAVYWLFPLIFVIICTWYSTIVSHSFVYFVTFNIMTVLLQKLN